MNILIGYPAAASFWLTANSKIRINNYLLSNRTLVPKPRRFDCALAKDTVRELKGRYGLSGKLTLMVPEGSARIRRKDFSTVYCPDDLRAGAFVELGRFGTVTAEGGFETASVLIASPELCFMQAGAVLDFHSLVRLGHCLCGRFVTEEKNGLSGAAGKESSEQGGSAVLSGKMGLSRAAGKESSEQGGSAVLSGMTDLSGVPGRAADFKYRGAITTVQSISDFLDKCPGQYGVKQARTAIKYVMDGAASPDEVRLGMLAALPLGRGGLAVPGASYEMIAAMNGRYDPEIFQDEISDTPAHPASDPEHGDPSAKSRYGGISDTVASLTGDPEHGDPSAKIRHGGISDTAAGLTGEMNDKYACGGRRDPSDTESSTTAELDAAEAAFRRIMKSNGQRLRPDAFEKYRPLREQVFYS